MIQLELDTKEWMELNAKLQVKKNLVRKSLAEQGVQQKDRTNKFDKYTYFSEAGYKKLFTELFSEHGLELTTSENEITDIEGTDGQKFGRRVRVEFCLADIETGFFETSYYTGEGLDKGDKSIYKAYTGALKYYFANTFNVATGDDPETESPEGAKEGRAYGAAKKQDSPLSEEAQNQRMMKEAGARLVDKAKKDVVKLQCEKKGVKPLAVCRKYGIQSVDEMTVSMFVDALKNFEIMPDKKPVDLGL